MKELAKRLAPTLGFVIKVVEKAGSPLKNNFPLNNLWEGTKCGREECIPCIQGAKVLPNCTQPSLVYENVCRSCNQGAANKREEQPFRTDIPTLYVGETGRSLHERIAEHWKDWRSGKDDSHMLRHQRKEHGADTEPDFIIRAVKYHKTALYRQLGEAIRIRRRGGQGSILNSKAEYDRCYIPRLVVEEKDIKEMEQREQQFHQEVLEHLEMEDEGWRMDKLKSRTHLDKEESRKVKELETRSRGEKREQENIKQKRSKKLKHATIGKDWGREQQGQIDSPLTCQEQELIKEQPKSWEHTLSPKEQPEQREHLETLVEPSVVLTLSPPKEQRPRRRSRQLKLTAFMEPVARPERGLPEPAGKDNNAIENPYKNGNVEMFENVVKETEVLKLVLEEQEMEQNTNHVPPDTDQEPLVHRQGSQSVLQPEPPVTRSVNYEQRGGFLEEKENTEVAVRSNQARTNETNTDNPMCNIREDGVCEIHGVMSSRIQVTSKKWRQRGGSRGFGWVSQKVTKFICRAKNIPPVAPSNSTEYRNLSHVAREESESKPFSEGDAPRGL